MSACNKDAFLDSLGRCRATSGFLVEFYKRFVGTNPAIQHRFRLTKIEKQASLLDESLTVCAEAVGGDSEALVRLSELARLHDRDHLDIHPEWYALWLDALVATAAEIDPEWTDETEAAWRATLGHVIHRMISKYEGRVGL